MPNFGYPRSSTPSHIYPWFLHSVFTSFCDTFLLHLRTDSFYILISLSLSLFFCPSIFNHHLYFYNHRNSTHCCNSVPFSPFYLSSSILLYGFAFLESYLLVHIFPFLNSSSPQTHSLVPISLTISYFTLLPPHIYFPVYTSVQPHRKKKKRQCVR